VARRPVSYELCIKQLQAAPSPVAVHFALAYLHAIECVAVGALICAVGALICAALLSALVRWSIKSVPGHALFLALTMCVRAALIMRCTLLVMRCLIARPACASSSNLGH
jgi:hypothetical protein